MYSVIRCNQPNRSTLFPYTTLFRSDRMVFLDRLDFTAFIIFHRITQRLFELLQEFEKALGDPVKDDEGRERSEEHTSELHSRFDLVCRLLLEKKNQSTVTIIESE